jgi:tRNA threonylcarbamoyladenosine biosynthesis protein TsaE
VIKLEIKKYIKSLENTDSLAKVINENLFPGFILGLTGDLGSGKTTFTKYLAKHMGIQDNLNSPTFTILKIYENDINLYHMDVYRLEKIGYDYELDDYIYGNGISVIEWYQYIEEMLPNEILEIDIKVLDESNRELTIKGKGRYEEIVKNIDNRYSD